MNMTQATVTKAPRLVNTKFGERIVFDALVAGREEAIWNPAAPDKEWILGLSEGEVIPAAIDRKGKIHLVDPAPQPTQHRPAAAPQAQPSQVQAIEQFVGKNVQLYRHCWGQVAGSFDGLSEESIRAISTTIYLQTVKEFDIR